MAIRVQETAFDPGFELNALHAANVGIGAVVGFVGYVRDFNDGQDVAGMFLEHYPGMTEKALEKIAAEARERWPLLNVDILHRICCGLFHRFDAMGIEYGREQRGKRFSRSLGCSGIGPRVVLHKRRNGR